MTASASFRRFPALTVFLLPMLLSACGGGGNSADLSAVFAGTWRGTLVSTVDSCFLGLVQNAVHQVGLNGDVVSLTAADGRVFTGKLTSETSLQAEAGSTAAFEMSDRINYANVAGGSAQVVLRHTWNRPGGCVQEWTGTMKRD